MTALVTYIKQFAHLRRAFGVVWSAATKNQAPHKPILLLALLDLVARGVISSSFIAVTGDLVELNELFNLYWRRIIPLGQTSSIAFPFSRLHTEPFWELVPLPGKEINPATKNNVNSLSQLRTLALGARMDLDLFYYMQQPESRNALREALLQSCFSEDARMALKEQACINAEAYSYSLELEQKAHLPLVQETLDADSYKTAARDQGFRRIVIKAYDHRCALCGVRIITPEQYTVVDAAHIIPWSKSKNDDIRNGMALCKLCHWSFDNGMLGVSDSYNIVTSRHIGSHSNTPGFLLTLNGRNIIPPSDRDLWPAQQYLAEHRRGFGL